MFHNFTRTKFHLFAFPHFLQNLFLKLSRILPTIFRLKYDFPIPNYLQNLVLKCPNYPIFFEKKCPGGLKPGIRTEPRNLYIFDKNRTQECPILTDWLQRSREPSKPFYATKFFKKKNVFLCFIRLLSHSVQFKSEKLL